MNLAIITSTIIAAIIVTFLISFPIINILYRFKIVRSIDVDFSVLIESRKHKVGTPIMGGLMFVFTILLFNILNISYYNLMPLMAFSFIALIGGIDDVLNIYGKKRRHKSLERVIKLIKVHKYRSEQIKLIVLLPWYAYRALSHSLESNPGKGLFAHEKLIAQLLVAAAFSYWFMGSGYFADPSMLWIPVLGSIAIGFLMVPVIIIGIMGMINAVNFSDGMDGLSAGMLLSAYAGFMIIAILQNNFDIAFLCASVIGGLITYLYFNVPPARVQMGDVGSYSLGGLLAIIGFMLQVPFLLVIIGFPFVLEVLSTIIQSFVRRVFGRRVLKMAPLHHHFEMQGWSEEKVVMRFWLLSLVSALFGLWLYLI